MDGLETVRWDQDPTIWYLAALMIEHDGNMAEVLVGRREKDRARVWLRVSKAALVLLEARNGAAKSTGLIPTAR